jgi:hypothetical protein
LSHACGAGEDRDSGGRYVTRAMEADLEVAVYRQPCDGIFLISFFFSSSRCAHDRSGH